MSFIERHRFAILATIVALGALVLFGPLLLLKVGCMFVYCDM